ncbi:Miniconductance mechanosensitive channel MscM precursor [compost metagenome]
MLTRSAHAIVVLLGLSFVLLTLPGARQIGASLLASAGVAGLVAGIAARPVLGNFIAGLQIAFSQPIRIDDVLIVNGEWGTVEEIKGTYVVVRVWDERRLIVPLQWFIENPFENWTHTSSEILGTVFLWLDFSIPIEPLRAELTRICEAAPQWDGRVCTVQATDSNERAVRVRFLISAVDSGKAFELRCLVREQMLAFITTHYPHGLPRLRSTHDPIELHAMQAQNDSVSLHKA